MSTNRTVYGPGGAPTACASSSQESFPRTEEELRWFEQGLLAGATIYAGVCRHGQTKSSNQVLSKAFEECHKRAAEYREQLPKEEPAPAVAPKKKRKG